MSFKYGYSIIENIFTADECEKVCDSLFRDEASRSRAGLRNLMSHREIAALACDPRLIEIGRSITDRSLIPYKATLFNKTGRSNWLVAWHQDTALPLEEPAVVFGWGPITIKDKIYFAHAPTSALQKVLALRIHLDASSENNGPLRVIPGSHTSRILDDSEFKQVVNVGDKKLLTVGRGGVIAMSPLLVHASSKCISDEPRRVLHIEYAESLELEPGIKLAVA